MAIDSATLAASGSEMGIQRAILNEITKVIRPHWRLVDLIYHVPNGGYRGEGKSAAIAGNNLKLMGTKAGVPDLCFPFPKFGFGALYMEVKRPKDGGLDPDQLDFIPMLLSANNFVAVIDDWYVGFMVFYDWIYMSDTADWMAKYGTGVNKYVFDPQGYMQKASKKRRKQAV
jgi:hypothetical protein